MIKNLNIGPRLGLAFGLVLVLLVAITVFGTTRLGLVNESTALIVKGRFPKVALGTSILDAAKDTSIGMHNLLITDDAQRIAKELALITAKDAEVNVYMDRFAATVSSPKGLKIFNELKAAKNKYEVDRTQFLSLVAAGNKADATTLLLATLEADQAAYLAQVRSMVDLGSALMLKDGEDAERVYRTSARLLMGLAAIAILLAAVLAYWISRSITIPLGRAVVIARTIAGGDLSSVIEPGSRDEAGQLLLSLREMNGNLVRIVSEVRSSSGTIAIASKEINEGTMDLSSRTEQQAASLEETASSMEELTSTVRRNAANAQEANEIAKLASGVAAQGGAEVAEVVERMKLISDSSRKIGDIISVIDGIAFQTNILALNAAVEAARAGEQGRGFAVVASEVRSLAQRSAAAAKEIKVLINDSTEKVDAGSKFAGEIGNTMADIVKEIQRVSAIMGEINIASQEQTVGIDQVNLAITQMDHVTQQNAALVEEAAAAAESMHGQTRLLTESVSVFVLGDQAGASVVQASASRVHRSPEKNISPGHLQLD
jgi:methyl-accepting chemotaxis protein